MQIGIKDMKVLAINAHLFTILHLGDPPLSSIKAQSAHGVMSQEEVTRVRRDRKEKREIDRGGESSGSRRISSFRLL